MKLHQSLAYSGYAHHVVKYSRLLFARSNNVEESISLEESIDSNEVGILRHGVHVPNTSTIDATSCVRRAYLSSRFSASDNRELSVAPRDYRGGACEFRVGVRLGARRFASQLR